MNALNFGFDMYEFVEQVTDSAQSVQMHLAGGIYDEKFKMHMDTHSHPIPDPVFDLYRFALEKSYGKCGAVFVERDQNFPGEEGWRGEIGRVRQIADEVNANLATSAA